MWRGKPRFAAGAGGFTLIEVMLAITIFAMVIGVIFSAFQVGITSWQRGDRDTVFHQSMRAATELIYRQISSTYPYRVTPGMLDVHRNFSVFFGSSDSLIFVSTATLHNRIGGLSLIELWVDDSRGLMLGEAPALFSSYDDMRAIDLRSDEHSAVLSAWVTRADFRYFEREQRQEEGSWQDSWDPRGRRGHDLPLMVEVSLLFEDVRGQEIEQKVIVPVMSLPF